MLLILGNYIVSNNRKLNPPDRGAYDCFPLRVNAYQQVLTSQRLANRIPAKNDRYNPYTTPTKTTHFLLEFGTRLTLVSTLEIISHESHRRLSPPEK